MPRNPLNNSVKSPAWCKLSKIKTKGGDWSKEEALHWSLMCERKVRREAELWESTLGIGEKLYDSIGKQI